MTTTREKLTISRKRWLRGSTVGLSDCASSSLHRKSDDLQCCLGIYLEDNCEIDRTVLTEMADPADLAQQGFIAPDDLPDWLYDYDHLGRLGGSELSSMLIEANDDQKMSESAREPLIAQLFARAGVDVTYVD